MLEDTYDTFFNTLANRKRLRILDYLKDHEAANVTDISDALGINQSTASQNLLRLESCGFVEREKDGKHRIYRINENTIEPLMELIEEHVHNYCANVACETCES
jgi:DNA-binding transcriptional ArsR family regulator